MLQIMFPGGLAALFAPIFLSLPVIYYGASSSRRKSLIPKNWEEPLRDIRFLTSYLWPRTPAERKPVVQLSIAMLVCVSLVRGIKLLTPFMFRRILGKLANSPAQQGPFPWAEVAIYILTRYALINVMSFVEWLVTKRVEGWLLDRINLAVYNKILALSADYHDNKNSGTVFLTVYSSGQAITGFASKVFFDIVPSILDLILAIGAVGVVYGFQFAGVVVFALAAYIYMLSHSSKLKGRGTKVWNELRSIRDAMASDTIANWWTVSTFGRLDYEQNRYAHAVSRFRNENIAYCESHWLDHNVKHLVLAVSLLVVSLFISYEIWQNPVRSPGDLGLFLQLWNNVAAPAQHITDWSRSVTEFITNAEKVIDILRRDITLKDQDDDKNVPDFQPKDGSIHIENAVFYYPEKPYPTLQGISLTIRGGQTIAIVGASGGGKSTLLKLLLRAYDCTSGSVCIDGQDVRNVRRTSLLEHISIVPQTIGVFNASVMDNLRYARLDATLEECEEVCKAVGLHEKIVKSFSNGYDEIIGEKGIKLSGGELQRLAIARVLLRQAQIVLLDEPTSSLDSETEGKIQTYLRTWAAGRTVIIVAHRLASVSHADLILAIKDGSIIEQGSHEELLAKKGYFYELWDRQRLG